MPGSGRALFIVTLKRRLKHEIPAQEAPAGLYMGYCSTYAKQDVSTAKGKETPWKKCAACFHDPAAAALETTLYLTRRLAR